MDKKRKTYNYVKAARRTIIFDKLTFVARTTRAAIVLVARQVLENLFVNFTLRLILVINAPRIQQNNQTVKKFILFSTKID